MDQTEKIPFLRENDEIRIVAPASVVEKGYIKNTVAALNELGYKVSLGEYVFSVYNQFSGTDEQRLKDLQNALDDRNVKAIFCARGGYGSVRLLSFADFGKFINHPKWVVGFSDITIFHSLINNQLGLPTIHAPMPVNFVSEYFSENLNQLHNILKGNEFTVSTDNHPLNINGTASGTLVGGNLSILYSLQSTPWELDTSDKILFIEEVGEQLYHVDRMLQNFRLSGKFERLKGLIVGGLTGMKDKKRPFGKSAEEIIREHIENLRIPVIFGFPAGHIENNIPFVLGKEVKMKVSGAAEIRY